MPPVSRSEQLAQQYADQYAQGKIDEVKYIQLMQQLGLVDSVLDGLPDLPSATSERYVAGDQHRSAHD